MSGTNRPRLLVLIVAYHAEKTIQQVLIRIPASLLDDYEVEVSPNVEKRPLSNV